ncbi:MAG: L,D-transpeptidase family protein, partial [Nocardioides sp.]
MIRTPLALIVALVALLPGAADASSPAPRADVIRLDGVAVHLRPGTRQVVTVNHTSGTHARVSLWALRHEGWRRILTT